MPTYRCTLYPTTYKNHSLSAATLVLLTNSARHTVRRPQVSTPYFFSTNSLNTPQMTGAASGPTLFCSPYCAFFKP